MVKKWLLAVLSALVILVPQGTPASADEPWVSPECATGKITQSGVEGKTIIWLKGWSAVCSGPADTGYQFGLGLYSDNHAWLGGLTKYQGLDSTPFGYAIDDAAATEELGSPIEAICLVSAPNDRIACVSVVRQWTGEPSALEPLSVDAPPVEHVIDDRCATCLH